MALTKKQKAVVSRWVKALRSGEYKQGKEWLHQKNDRGQDRFCCLGVLCDLAVKAKVISAPVADNEVFIYDKEDTHLPPKVRKWAGIKTPNGDFEFGDSLAEVNDDGKKFTTIAKIIESKPDGLFV
jgi:hypothetical protein